MENMHVIWLILNMMLHEIFYNMKFVTSVMYGQKKLINGWCSSDVTIMWSYWTPLNDFLLFLNERKKMLIYSLTKSGFFL